MKNKFQTIIFAMTAILSLPVVSETMEIRQEKYDFQMDITRNVSCITFVIREISGRNSVPAQSYPLPAIHFELGIAVLSSMAGQKLLASMLDTGIGHDTPLVITGHSCELGSDEYNLTLSLQRAVAVATFLERHGFTVTTLRAEGEADPLTTNPQEFFKNRRVEITQQ